MRKVNDGEPMKDTIRRGSPDDEGHRTTVTRMDDDAEDNGNGHDVEDDDMSS